MNPNELSKIQSLTSKVYTHCKKYATPALPVDDLAQIALEKILAHAEEDPGFLENTDAYIVQYGVWRAKNSARGAARYSKYVEDEGEMVTGLKADELEDDEIVLDFVVDASAVNPEEALEYSILADKILEVAATMPVTSRRIIEYLAIGYNQPEIASLLHITKQAVGQRIKTIAATLTRSGLQLDY